jgi:hypothetical protein
MPRCLSQPANGQALILGVSTSVWLPGLHATCARARLTGFLSWLQRSRLSPVYLCLRWVPLWDDVVLTERTMGKSQQASMAITTAGDRSRTQRLTEQERRFSVSCCAEKLIERDAQTQAR